MLELVPGQVQEILKALELLGPELVRQIKARRAAVTEWQAIAEEIRTLHGTLLEKKQNGSRCIELGLQLVSRWGCMGGSVWVGVGREWECGGAWLVLHSVKSRMSQMQRCAASERRRPQPQCNVLACIAAAAGGGGDGLALVLMLLFPGATRCRRSSWMQYRRPTAGSTPPWC